MPATSARRINRRRLLRSAAALAAAPVASPFIARIDSALAAWPADRPVRIVVAASPGGPSDLMARLIAPVLQEALGGAFVVENKPGGGANVGMLHVARAEPDGYTLHVSTSVFAMNVSLYDPPPYNWQTDLVPVAELGNSPSVFVVQPSLGVSSMKDLVALARKDQAAFNIATPPIGSTLHLGAELLKLREGLGNVAVVVHSGGGAAIQALLTGAVQACSSSLAPAHAHIKAGTLKGLVILGEQRWHDLPEVPTTKEVGYDDFNFETTTALMAPARTPPELMARLERAAIEGLSKPKVRDRILKAGFIVDGKSGRDHALRIARDVKLFGDIIRKAGIKPKAL